MQARVAMDKAYVPNFKLAFEHFLVHTGGRAVIEEVEKNLVLDPRDVQPSKETLYRYGNTCCAAVFYVLTNVESKVPHCSHNPSPLPLLPRQTSTNCNAAWTKSQDMSCIHVFTFESAKLPGQAVLGSGVGGSQGLTG